MRHGTVPESGALRFFDRDPQQIAQLVRLGALALHGISTTVGSASNRVLAAMAGDATASGGITPSTTPLRRSLPSCAPARSPRCSGSARRPPASLLGTD
ncbi:hypothetical protein ACFYXH_38765 [Streptomyces sp. NPDC002730]|uniref:hypothetical protein n=1 Tax=Streptomyces sp. NPDC002730 TaxID=3364662 RepID=UPI0036AC291C